MEDWISTQKVLERGAPGKNSHSIFSRRSRIRFCRSRRPEALLEICRIRIDKGKDNRHFSIFARAAAVSCSDTALYMRSQKNNSWLRYSWFSTMMLCWIMTRNTIAIFSELYRTGYTAMQQSGRRAI